MAEHNLETGTQVQEGGPLRSMASQPVTSSAQPILLLVEDNDDLREYLSEVLVDDYQILTACNGKTALHILEEQRKKKALPNLIITDLMMPEMDGFQLLQYLKDDAELALVPTVVLSARAAAGDRLKALRTGIDDYLLKPFEENELRQRIHNLLANANARKQALSTGQPANPAETDLQPPSPSAEDGQWLRAVEAIVREQLATNDFGNEELATRLFVSPRTLSRRIKLLTGLSTNKFMLEIRLQTARALLETRPRPTLGAIAEQVGFKKASYFSTRFRERFGILPSEYGL